MKPSPALVDSARVCASKASADLGLVGPHNLPASLALLVKAEQNLRVATAAVTLLIQRAKGNGEQPETRG